MVDTHLCGDTSKRDWPQSMTLFPTSLQCCRKRAAEIPMIGDIASLFAWIRPDDTMLVDGDTAVVRINPSATRIAKYRRLPDAGK